MDQVQHYHEAERLLRYAADEAPTVREQTVAVDSAQVHALLALAAVQMNGTGDFSSHAAAVGRAAPAS